jgi:hypothetical protein
MIRPWTTATTTASTSKDICEAALLNLDGQELLDDAMNMARSHVDAEHPWSGLEPEPAARVAA